MATSGSLTSSKYDGRYYKLTWKRTKEDVTNNKSTIEWTLSAVGGDVNWYAEHSLKVVVAGKTVFENTTREERWEGEIKSGTLTISHDTDGTKSFSASIQAAVFYSTVNCTGSKTFTLDAIPRKSTLAVTGGTLGSEETLTITEKVSTFKHKVKYSCGTASAWILGGANSTSTNLSFKWTPPLNLAKQNTAAKSVSVKFTLYTYTEGGALVGSNEYTKNFTIPEQAVVNGKTVRLTPSLSISLSDPTGYFDTYGTYIQGKSKVKISSIVSGEYDATISSCKATFEGTTYSKNPAESNVIASSGNDKLISVTAVDSRGYKTTITDTIDVCEYSKPTITFTFNRDKATLNCTYTATFTSIGGQNNASVIIYVDGKPEQTIDNVGNGTTGTISVPLGSADISYKIHAEVKDALGESASTVTQKTIGGSRIMNIHPTGTGIAFGKKARENCLDSEWPIYTGGNMVATAPVMLYPASITSGTAPSGVYQSKDGGTSGTAGSVTLTNGKASDFKFLEIFYMDDYSHCRKSTRVFLNYKAGVEVELSYIYPNTTTTDLTATARSSIYTVSDTSLTWKKGKNITLENGKSVGVTSVTNTGSSSGQSKIKITGVFGYK